LSQGTIIKQFILIRIFEMNNSFTHLLVSHTNGHKCRVRVCWIHPFLGERGVLSQTWTHICTHMHITQFNKRSWWEHSNSESDILRELDLYLKRFLFIFHALPFAPLPPLKGGVCPHHCLSNPKYQIPLKLSHVAIVPPIRIATPLRCPLVTILLSVDS